MAGDRNPPRLHAAVARQITQYGKRGSGFATAGFANQPVRLAAFNPQRDVLQHFAVSPARTVCDRQADQGECVGFGALRSIEDGESRWRRSVHRSSTPCMPSATRFTPTTSEAMAA